MTVPAEASEKERRTEVDSLLDTILGAGRADLQVQERRHLGSIVHIFSHIRMTLHVERLVVKVSSGPCLCTAPDIERRECNSNSQGS